MVGCSFFVPPNQYVSHYTRINTLTKKPGVWVFLVFLVFLPAAALQRLGLIQNHVLPFDPLEVLHVLDHQLVARDHHMERGILRVQCFLFIW